MSPRRSGRERKPTMKGSDSSSDTKSSPPPAPAQKSSPVPAQPKVTRKRQIIPPVNATADPKMWQSDFKAFGYSDDQIDVYKMMKEPVVDATTQITGTSYHHRQIEYQKRCEAFIRKITRKRNSPGKVGKKNAKTPKAQILLKGNWALFDPARGYPPTLDHAPPQIFFDYQTYKPGNRKIVAISLDSFSVKLQQTPAEFEGHEVVYSAKEGVKLAKLPARKDSLAPTAAAE